MTVAKSARYLLYGLLFWLPLPLGSNRPVYWVANAVVACIAAALFVAGEATARQRSLIDWRPAVLPLLGAGIWIVWMVVQAWPDMPASLRHPVWPILAGDLPGRANTISANPGATWSALVQCLPAILLSVVAMRVGANRRHARFLLTLIIGIAVVIAAYGLGARYLGVRQVFLAEGDAYEGYLTSLFVSRNAVAAYLTIGLVAAAAMLAQQWTEATRRDRRGGGWRFDLVRWLSSSSGVMLAFLTISVAIYNTGSRAGSLAAIAGLVAVAFASGGGSVGNRRRSVAVALVGVFAVLLLGSGSVLGRLRSSLWGDGRVEVFRDTLDMIAARPLLGHGAGTFADSFQAFHERAPVNVVWNKAHNTYLQAASELGLPVFAILLVTLAGLTVSMFVRIMRRGEPSTIAVAACGAVAASALHSLVDFTVQVQAVGTTLAILLGAGLGELSAPASGQGANRPPARPAASTRTVTSRESISVAAPRDGDDTTATSLPAFARIPDDWRLYAFGDLHGRLDLFHRLQAAIARDIASNPPKHALVIGLGDYIDRGAQSAEVLDALAGDAFPVPSLFLRGNHEQMLLDFLDDPKRSGALWLRNGGIATIRSYGVPLGGRDIEKDLVAIRDALMVAIAPAHLMLLGRMPMSYQAGDYFFVHAGARPGIPLPHQSADDLLWIREGFSDRDEPFERVIVHGHTPVDQPYFGQYRINIDTGAHFTGRLTCLVLQGFERRLLDV